MNEILNAIGKNPDIKLVVYGIIGIVILYVVLRLFKLPLKLLINGIFGVILLYSYIRSLFHHNIVFAIFL